MISPCLSIFYTWHALIELGNGYGSRCIAIRRCIHLNSHYYTQSSNLHIYRSSYRAVFILKTTLKVRISIIWKRVALLICKFDRWIVIRFIIFLSSQIKDRLLSFVCFYKCDPLSRRFAQYLSFWYFITSEIIIVLWIKFCCIHIRFNRSVCELECIRRVLEYVTTNYSMRRLKEWFHIIIFRHEYNNCYYSSNRN